VSLLNCAEVLERVILGHDRPILEDASSAIRGNSFTDLASSINSTILKSASFIKESGKTDKRHVSSDRRCRSDKSRLDFQQAVTILPVRVPLFHPSNSLQYQHDCACALIGVYQKHGHLELQFETLCHHCGWSQPFVKSRCHVLAGHSRVLKLFIAMCHVPSQAFPKTPPVQNIGVSFRLPSGILRGSITLRFFHHLILFFFD